MAFPSRVLGAGTPGGTTRAICGDVANTLTAAGSTAADALALSAVFNRTTTTASGTGVKLPPAEAGAVCFVVNSGANSLTVYPQTGSTIDAGSSVSVAAAARTMFFATSATQWFSK